MGVYTRNMKTITKTKTIVGPASCWDPVLTHKTITIKVETWRRLQRYFNKYGDTFDLVISDILDAHEGKQSLSGGSF